MGSCHCAMFEDRSRTQKEKDMEEEMMKKKKIKMEQTASDSGDNGESSESATLGTPPESPNSTVMEGPKNTMICTLSNRTDPNIDDSELKKETTPYDAYKRGVPGINLSAPTMQQRQPSTKDIFSSTKTAIIHENEEQTPMVMNDYIENNDDSHYNVERRGTGDLFRLKSSTSSHHSQKSTSESLENMMTPKQPEIQNILSSNRGWSDEKSMKDLELTEMMDEMSTLDRRLSATDTLNVDVEVEAPRRGSHLFNAEDMSGVTENDLDDGAAALEQQISMLRRITSPPEEPDEEDYY